MQVLDRYSTTFCLIPVLRVDVILLVFPNRE
jgi:hypothetical protein